MRKFLALSLTCILAFSTGFASTGSDPAQTENGFILIADDVSSEMSPLSVGECDVLFDEAEFAFNSSIEFKTFTHSIKAASEAAHNCLKIKRYPDKSKLIFNKARDKLTS